MVRDLPTVFGMPSMVTATGENCRFPHTHRMVPESELASQQPRSQLQHSQPQQRPQPSVPVGALDALPGQGPFGVHQELHHPGLGLNVVTVKVNHSLAKKAPPPGAVLDGCCSVL